MPTPTPDDNNQASVGSAPVTVDNPSPVIDASVEKGSLTEDAAANQEHRDWSEMDADELLTKHPKLTDLDPEKLVSSNPALKSYLARKAKSEADKAVNAALQRKEVELQAQRASQQAAQQEAEWNRLLEEGDPNEIVERIRETRKRDKEINPLLEQTRQVAKAEGYSEGQLAELRNTGATLAEIFPFWRDMELEQRQEYLKDFREPREGIVRVIKDGIEKAVEARMRDLEKKVSGEDEIEKRKLEKSPVVGGGGAVPGSSTGLVTQKEFDANRGDQKWRQANLERIKASIGKPNGILR